MATIELPARVSALGISTAVSILSGEAHRRADVTRHLRSNPGAAEAQAGIVTSLEEIAEMLTHLFPTSEGTT